MGGQSGSRWLGARARARAQRSFPLARVARAQRGGAEELVFMESDRGSLPDGIGGMMQRPLRILLVSTHPVQYATPIFRLLAPDSRVEIQVAYCSMQGAEAQFDPDFGVPVKWDIPLLQGYPWVHLPNRLGEPKLGSFFGMFNPEIWPLIRRGNFDAVVLFTGYIYATFWLAVAAAKISGAAVLFGTDATSLQPRDRSKWKLP